jgi:hypothetical protein
MTEYSHQREASEIASWLCKARDQSRLDRITNSCKYNRNGSGLLLQDGDCPTAGNQDHIWLQI